MSPPSTTTSDNTVANSDAHTLTPHPRKAGPRDSLMIRNTKQQSKRLLNEQDLATEENDSGSIVSLIRSLSLGSMSAAAGEAEAEEKSSTPLTSTTDAEENPQDETGAPQASPPSTPKKARVQFGKAEYHEHAMIVGDNPACSAGVPITIEWKAFDSHTVELLSVQDNDEEAKRDDTSEHRSYLEMRVPPHVRDKICRSAGYTRSEMVRLCKPVNIARAQRLRTVETMSLQGIQEKLERANKGLKKVLRNKQERVERARLKEWRKPHQHPHLQRMSRSEPHLEKSAAVEHVHPALPPKSASAPDLDDSNTTRASTQPGDVEEQHI